MIQHDRSEDAPPSYLDKVAAATSAELGHEETHSESGNLKKCLDLHLRSLRLLIFRLLLLLPLSLIKSYAAF